MAPARRDDNSQFINLTVREYETLLDLLEKQAIASQRNHEEILVLKTKVGFVSVLFGVGSSIVTSVIIAYIVHALKLS